MKIFVFIFERKIIKQKRLPNSIRKRRIEETLPKILKQEMSKYTVRHFLLFSTQIPSPLDKILTAEAAAIGSGQEPIYRRM